MRSIFLFFLTAFSLAFKLYNFSIDRRLHFTDISSSVSRLLHTKLQYRNVFQIIPCSLPTHALSKLPTWSCFSDPDIAFISNLTIAVSVKTFPASLLPVVIKSSKVKQRKLTTKIKNDSKRGKYEIQDVLV